MRETERYDFDAALSFAGEDRRVAKRLASEIKSLGLKVFYDKDHSADLWGKQQTEYDSIYGPRSRFVIPMISRHYLRKDWTQYEFDSAKQEAQKRTTEFILPIRLDDSRLLGLHRDVNYLSLTENTIKEIAAKVAEKCGVSEKGQNRLASKAKPSSAILLPSAERHALGLIAVANGPVDIPSYQKLFPRIPWARYTRFLVAAGLVTSRLSFLSVDRGITRFYEADPEFATLNSEWIAALSPVGNHVDTAILLALHYRRANRINEMVGTLADVSETPLHGSWNSLYVTIWTAIAKVRWGQRLDPDSRCRMLNCAGICSAAAGKDKESLEWFKELHYYSSRHQRPFWVGQALINTGVAHAGIDQSAKAIRCYRTAISHGERTGDKLLVARSQGNLAGLIQDSNLIEARDLLKNSLRLKRALRDEAGRAVGYAQMGQLEVIAGNFKSGVEHFTRSKDIARRLGLWGTLLGVAEDLGKAYEDRALLSLALRNYRVARRIATKLENPERQLICGTAEGRVLSNLGRLKESLAVFRGVLMIAESEHQIEARISSLHAIGMLLRLTGRSREGIASLDAAINLARSSRNSFWISRCLLDKSRVITKRRSDGFDVSQLRRAAQGEQRKLNWRAAGTLWKACAERYLQSEGDKASIQDAFRASKRCFSKESGTYPDSLEILEHEYSWHWSVGKGEEAIAVLREIEALAGEADSRRDLARALDQRGICLQHLGNYKKAVTLHQRALRVAKGIPDTSQMGRSLNNLGEAFRKLGQFEKAITLLCDAEAVAMSNKDVPAALSVMENRVLAMAAQGEFQKAIQVATMARTRARTSKLWERYTSATTLAADLEWQQQRIAPAFRLYRLALEHAQRKKQTKLLPLISLNCARLALQAGNPSEAVRLLRRCNHDRFGSDNAHILHYTTGDAFTQLGNSRRARQHFQLGLQAAERLNNADYIALCSSRLAEINEAEGHLARSEEQIRVSLLNETDPEGRGLLLTQLLRVLLASGEKKKIDEVFDECRDLAVKNNLSTIYIDIHSLLSGYKSNRISWLELSSLSSWERPS